MRINDYVDVAGYVREFTPGQVSEIIKSAYKIAELSRTPGMQKVVGTELAFLAEYIEDAPIVEVKL